MHRKYDKKEKENKDTKESEKLEKQRILMTSIQSKLDNITPAIK